MSSPKGFQSCKILPGIFSLPFSQKIFLLSNVLFSLIAAIKVIIFITDPGSNISQIALFLIFSKDLESKLLGLKEG